MNLFKYTAFILISLISVYAPYVAYLNNSPNTVIENIDIELIKNKFLQENKIYPKKNLYNSK